MSRRNFLHGLAALPLIGGSVALVGRPTAAAAPTTPEMLNAYSQLLYCERKLLLIEQFGRQATTEAERFIPMIGAVSNFHFPSSGPSWTEIAQPSTRAAVV